MILSLLFSWLSLYPWNVGVSTYFTQGNYTDGRKYVSQAGYFSMDRRLKDGFTLGYEEITIKDSSYVYQQYNTVARSVFWIKPQLRLGATMARVVDSIGGKSWFWSGQIEGDWPWFGYALAYTYSDFQAATAIYGSASRFNTAVRQWDLILSRQVEGHVFHVGTVLQKLGSQRYNRWLVSWTYTFPDKSGLTAAYSGGTSRFQLDPFTLILDNNWDEINDTFVFEGWYRVSPHFTLIGSYAQRAYTTVLTGTPESFKVRYLVAGLAIRY